MVDLSDLNVSLCFETIVVVNILEVAGSIMVDLNLAVWITMEISTGHLVRATPTAQVGWNQLRPGRTGLI